MKLPPQSELEVETLGTCRVQSPLIAKGASFADDSRKVCLVSDTLELEPFIKNGEMPPGFEIAGPRREIFFDPSTVSCGIVTCGGLCPGLNNVIRSIVRTLHFVYGVRRVVGFPYGYAGLTAHAPAKPRFLTPADVDPIHEHGGTFLGSSRGPQDVREMVDQLVGWDIGILFAIGGDGTLRGAAAISEEIKRRKLPVSVIGIPKTIDNDIQWIQQSFGFLTAISEARPAIEAAHAEASGACNGVGLVKLMGRHSGFIAMFATLANPDVNFCLIPEVPFTLKGRGGFLDCLSKRLASRGHAVIVVAEGAGQDLFEASGTATDASGNKRLQDIGSFLKDAITDHFTAKGQEIAVKYIDPSYTIRSCEAGSFDAAYCLTLGQQAVHAGMAGRTNMVIGRWNQNFTHMPIGLATQRRNLVDPLGDSWQYLLSTTGQPRSMVGEA